jgi:hypothetical protein
MPRHSPLLAVIVQVVLLPSYSEAPGTAIGSLLLAPSVPIYKVSSIFENEFTYLL